MTIRSIADRLRDLPKNAASRATVGRWLSGESLPGDLELAALASILTVPAALLRGLAQLTPHKDLDGGCESPAWLWAEMVRGRPDVLLVGDSLMAIGLSRLATSVGLADTTILGLLQSPMVAIDASEPGRCGASADAATWLAAVDGLVEVSERMPSVRVRLWVRDRDEGDLEIRGSEFLASESMMFELCSACLDGFNVRVAGESDWEPVDALIVALGGESVIPGACLVYDSERPPMHSRDWDLARLRERVARSLLRAPEADSRQDRGIPDDRQRDSLLKGPCDAGDA